MSVCASVCLSVRPSVCLSGSHSFLVVTHCYVSQATHAFLGMLPLCFSNVHVFQPVDPEKETVIAVGSMKELVFHGGPQPWIIGYLHIFQPVDPEKETVIAVGSMKELVFHGGPQPWIMDTSQYFQACMYILNAVNFCGIVNFMFF